MMVNIKNSGKYCYVEGDDCYILYYLFGYRLNNDKCYFKSRYLELGNNKYEYDRYLLNIENKLNNMVDSKNFNKIYRKIIKILYE